jgi:SPP1 family predicted phage head-tail adaptor
MTNTQLGRRRSVNIRIQSKTSDRDSFGQPLNNWTDVCALQCRVRAARQNETFQSGQLTSQITHVIEAWWTAVSITGGMRAVFGSRVFLIQAVQNVEERNREILILCLELNASSLTVLPS